MLPSPAWIVSACKQASISPIPIHCPVLSNSTLSTNKREKYLSYQSKYDRNSRWVLDASAQLLSISMIYNLLDFRLIVSDANPTLGGDGVFALGR